MVQSIQYRRSHFLGNEEWRTLPWGRRSSKGAGQKLYEHGFSCGAIVEEADRAGLRKGSIDRQACLYYLGRLRALDAELQTWYQELLEECSRPYWLAPSIHPTVQSSQILGVNKVTSFAFPTPQTGNMMIKYWGIRLTVTMIITALCDAYQSRKLDFDLLPERCVDLPDTEDPINLYITRYDGAHAVELAVKITRAMPYFLQDGMGLQSAQQTIFPLRGSIYILHLYRSDELNGCQALYQELCSRKGLGYAREIAKVSGGYSKSGSPSPSPPPESGDALPYHVQASSDRLSCGSSKDAQS